MKFYHNRIILGFLLVKLSILSTNFSYAQTAIQEFSIEQGLPQSVVTSMVEDSLGYLWIGTQGGGIAKFDGITFDLIGAEQGIASNIIHDLAISKKGYLWAANAKAISKYDGSVFHNFVIDKENSPKQIYIHSDSLFFLNTRNGKMGYILNDVRFDIPYRHPLIGITSLRKADQSTILGVDILNRKLVVLNNGRYQSFAFPNNATSIYHFVKVGQDLVISADSGLYKVDGNHLLKISESIDILRLYDPLRSIYWVRRKDDLIAVKSLNDSNPIATIRNVLVNCTLLDKQGNVWFGTSGKGIIRVNDFMFLPVGEPKPLMERELVMSLLANRKGELWTGTISNGLIVYDIKDLKHVLFKKKLALCFTIKEDSSQLPWVGTKEGLFSFSGGAITQHYPEIDSVLSFDFGLPGEMVVSTAQRELFFIKNKKVSTISANKLLVSHVYFNKWTGEFLLGTDLGIKKLVDGTLQNIGLDSLIINSIGAFSNGMIVAGSSESGIFIFHKKKLRHFTIGDGLLSDQTYFVIPDNHYLWVGTEKGLNRIELNPAASIKEILSYGKQHGLEGLECNRNSFFLTDSTLFFSMVSGSYKLPTRLSEIKSDSRLHYTQFYFRNNGSDSSTRSLINPLDRQIKEKSITINHDQDHLIFSVNKVDKSYPNQYYYSINIKGPITIKSRHSKKTAYEYTNLMPGYYTLEVNATDASGNKIYDQLITTFYIQPAYYQTTWFYTLVVILTLSLISLIIYIYHRHRISKIVEVQQLQIQQESKLRTEIARDFHDELGNQVARLINSIELLRLEKKLELKMYQTLSEYSQRILRGTKDFVWTLNPMNDELVKVIIHLKDFGEGLFGEKNINFSFEGDLDFEKQIPTGSNRQITLIFKEAMTNVYKHAGATDVQFGVAFNQGFIQIYLIDNGIGIKQETLNRTERGISNMRFRSQKINSQLDILPNEHGTTVRLSIKI